jgi:hypothetical protein
MEQGHWQCRIGLLNGSNVEVAVSRVDIFTRFNFTNKLSPKLNNVQHYLPPSIYVCMYLSLLTSCFVSSAPPCVADSDYAKLLKRYGSPPLNNTLATSHWLSSPIYTCLMLFPCDMPTRASCPACIECRFQWKAVFFAPLTTLLPLRHPSITLFSTKGQAFSPCPPLPSFPMKRLSCRPTHIRKNRISKLGVIRTWI